MIDPWLGGPHSLTPRAGLGHVYHVCEHIQNQGFVVDE
jgi:hypothetical protein